MILRLATANENHLGEGGHDFSRAAGETHLQEALASEGYLSALKYVSKGASGAKAPLNTLHDGTTEVVPSPNSRVPNAIFKGAAFGRNQRPHGRDAGREKK